MDVHSDTQPPHCDSVVNIIIYWQLVDSFQLGLLSVCAVLNNNNYNNNNWLPSLHGDINIDTTHNGSAKYALFTFCRLTCGIIARSAGLFQNSKKFCACDGKILWEDKPLYVPTRSPPSQL